MKDTKQSLVIEMLDQLKEEVNNGKFGIGDNFDTELFIRAFQEPFGELDEFEENDTDLF